MLCRKLQSHGRQPIILTKAVTVFLHPSFTGCVCFQLYFPEVDVNSSPPNLATMKQNETDSILVLG